MERPTNKFDIVQEMVSTQSAINNLFEQLKVTIVCIENHCEKNNLAPKTLHQMRELRARGVMLLEELFITESRHSIRVQSESVSMKEIIASAAKQKTCIKCNGSGKLAKPDHLLHVCDMCQGSGQTSDRS